jgi:putative ABC transport system permease protein
MIRAGIRRLFSLPLRARRRWERDVEEEIMLHLALRAEQLTAAGQSTEDAYAEAVRRFGPLHESRARLLDAARHRERHMQRTEWLADARQDLTFALRTLGRRKGWTAITILTLALGIGATTAVFSAVSSLLLHPLPYPNADRIVLVDKQTTRANDSGIDVSISVGSKELLAWRRYGHSFEALEPYATSTMSLETAGEPADLTAAMVTPTFAAFAGQRAIAGRNFTDADLRAHDHAALLGEALWRTRYGADPAVVGKSIHLDDSIYTIVGVMPSALRIPNILHREADVWLPIDLAGDTSNAGGYSVVGRLRTGVDAASATRELDAILRRVPLPGTNPNMFHTRVQTPKALVPFRNSLILLMGAVALVLLVACANVAHLVLAMSASRDREMAIRAALGAARRRLLRQVLTESLALATLGAAAGVFLGWAGLEVIVALRPQALSELSAASLDRNALGLAVVLGVASGVVFGLIGALRSARRSPNDSLKSAATSASHSRRHERARALLVISEMAMSAMLLVGATLLVRSVIHLEHVDLGFDPHGLYTLNVALPHSRYADSVAVGVYERQLADRVRAIPGVRSASATAVIPSEWYFRIGGLQVQGDAPPPNGATQLIHFSPVSPSYFKTMGIRLLEGRIFDDSSATSDQVLVNAGFARAHWPAGHAVGHRIRIVYNGNGTWMTITGVVADVATMGPLAKSSDLMLYGPISTARPKMLVRMQAASGSVGLLRAAALSIDPRVRVTIDPVERLMAESISEPRFVMLLLTSFTVLALVLASVGLYGVMSYTVAQRTREIGIRIALGASAGRIARAVVGRAVALALVGAAAGLLGAVWATKLIESSLNSISRTDPASFIIGATLLIGAAVAASIVPMRRAVAVDPMTAIRTE